MGLGRCTHSVVALVCHIESAGALSKMDIWHDPMARKSKAGTLGLKKLALSQSFFVSPCHSNISQLSSSPPSCSSEPFETVSGSRPYRCILRIPPSPPWEPLHRYNVGKMGSKLRSQPLQDRYTTVTDRYNAGELNRLKGLNE